MLSTRSSAACSAGRSSSASSAPATATAARPDVNVLGTIGWDLGRFGIQYVASPRHADGIVILGPIPDNMWLAARKTYDAIPDPKIVIAIGACAISGGIYAGHPEQHDGAESMLPVDLFIPGCPPHPLTILDGFLRLLGRLEGARGPCSRHGRQRWLAKPRARQSPEAHFLPRRPLSPMVLT